VKKFGVEIRTGEPKFSGFRFPENFLFEQKIIQRRFEKSF
jgi:hypothetical protein